MNLKPRCRRPARYTHAHRSTAQQHNHFIAPYRNNMLHNTALHCTALHCAALHCTVPQRQVVRHRIAIHTVPRRALKQRWRGGEEADPHHEICGWRVWPLVLGHFCISCIPRGGLTQAFERCLKNSAGVTVNMPRAHQWYVHMRPMEPLRSCA